ncbi:MAG: hypothetical protein QXT13_05375 [Pyrobaculum sp.]
MVCVKNILTNPEFGQFDNCIWITTTLYTYLKCILYSECRRGIKNSKVYSLGLEGVLRLLKTGCVCGDRKLVESWVRQARCFYLQLYNIRERGCRSLAPRG